MRSIFNWFFCALFAAHSASATPAAPLLEIHPAVEVTFPTEAGINYHLEVSTNLTNWEILAAEIPGTGTPFSEFFSARGKRYYRLQALPPIIAPLTEGDLFDYNNIFILTPAGQADMTLRFPVGGQYTLVQDAILQSGAIAGAQRINNTWTFTMISDAGQTGALTGTMRLDFVQRTAGTWTFTPEGGVPQSGTFSIAVNSPTQTLTLNYAGGGGEKFEFQNGTSVSYENGMEIGTYTYDPATRQFDIVLGNGWIYAISLSDDENATVVWRESSTASPETSAATYILR